MTLQVALGRPRPASLAVPSEGERTYRSAVRRLAWAIPLASIDGATLVFVCVLWVLPQPAVADPGGWVRLNVAVFVGYLAFTIALGSWLCHRLLLHAMGWLRAGRAPDERELRTVLRMPLMEAVISGVMWAGAAVLFAFVDRSLPDVGLVVTAIVLAGLSNCALDYLLAERLLRPVFAVALAATAHPSRSCGRVAPRMLISWLFCTGVPVLGIGLAIAANGDLPVHRMVGPVFFLVAMALVSGVAGAYVATRSVSDPVSSLRDAMARVSGGDVGVSVEVYDGSELGALQAGFNAMVAGLRERRALQDLFGRHVGPDVARRALERGVELGGETRDVAVLFVDVRGSTQLASTRPAAEVVALLNRFFGTVVEVVGEHGGWVDKFEGDGALCVFGAPLPLPQPATAALRAARVLRERLGAASGLDAGIGVAFGPVVAGNVGAETRYEYTVIGDAVNEAARLTELAKLDAARVLASGAVLDCADPAESARWVAGESAVLRGRATATVLARPVAAAAAGRPAT